MLAKMQGRHTMEEILEGLYASSGVILLFFFGITGLNRLDYPPSLQLILLVWGVIGAYQLFAIWLLKMMKPWSIIMMVLLSSLAILALLLPIPVFQPRLSELIIPMYFLCLLNVVNLGLLSQDSIVSKSLHRQQTLENDGPVLINVVLHSFLGGFLFILVQGYMTIRGPDMTLLGSSLMNAIWTIGMLFLIIVILLIVRWRYAWILFLVLDVLLLTFGLLSLFFAFQSPGQLVLPTAYYGEWVVRSIQDVGLAGITCGISLLLALVYSIPALDKRKTLIRLNNERHEG
ncbi:MAG: hypothetical protein OEV85_03770 [Candidatus Thorarchaeota archaeon]|nr:hypothetical protein [Candidatus Thorarchaeota archaeon]